MFSHIFLIFYHIFPMTKRKPPVTSSSLTLLPRHFRAQSLRHTLVRQAQDPLLRFSDKIIKKILLILMK